MFPFAYAVDTRLCAELAFLNAMDEYGSAAKRHQTLESALVGMTDWPMRGKAGGMWPRWAMVVRLAGLIQCHAERAAELLDHLMIFAQIEENGHTRFFGGFVLISLVKLDHLDKIGKGGRKILGLQGRQSL